MKKTVLLLLCFFMATANANDNRDVFSLSLIELENLEVSTTSKYKEKRADSPGNIMVITRQEINERGYKSLDDLLKRLPGVDLQESTFFSSKNIVTFSGNSGNNKFIILQEGVRIGPAAGETTIIARNPHFIMPNRVRF